MQNYVQYLNVCYSIGCLLFKWNLVTRLLLNHHLNIGSVHDLDMCVVCYLDPHGII